MNGTSPAMQWASAMSTRASLEGAVREVVEQLQGKFDGVPDLGLLFHFVVLHTGDISSPVAPCCRKCGPIPNLVGCSGGGRGGGMTSRTHSQGSRKCPRR